MTLRATHAKLTSRRLRAATLTLAPCGLLGPSGRSAHRHAEAAPAKRFASAWLPRHSRRTSAGTSLLRRWKSATNSHAPPSPRGLTGLPVQSHAGRAARGVSDSASCPPGTFPGTLACCHWRRSGNATPTSALFGLSGRTGPNAVSLVEGGPSPKSENARRL